MFEKERNMSLMNHFNVNTCATLEVGKYNDDSSLYFRNTVRLKGICVIPFTGRAILGNEMGARKVFFKASM
ncbi:hypothetical protein GCM10023261_07010 [Bartonella jaculi]|uniref:Uncharacterized protein n=1 Tax=Bartonella jaculi TaxID=686226 RepID=A0ABP9N182_9HYPH